jgi:hypothetical protein
MDEKLELDFCRCVLLLLVVFEFDDGKSIKPLGQMSGASEGFQLNFLALL